MRLRPVTCFTDTQILPYYYCWCANPERPVRDCQECKDLLARASETTTKHLDAIGRLQVATIRQEREKIPVLEQTVIAARAARAEAIAAFQTHERSHRAEAAVSASDSSPG